MNQTEEWVLQKAQVLFVREAGSAQTSVKGKAGGVGKCLPTESQEILEKSRTGIPLRNSSAALGAVLAIATRN